MEKFEIQGGNGYYSCNSGVVTFDIQGAAMCESIAEKEFRNLYARYLNENMTLQLQGFQVPVWGGRTQPLSPGGVQRHFRQQTTAGDSAETGGVSLWQRPLPLSDHYRRGRQKLQANTCAGHCP